MKKNLLISLFVVAVLALSMTAYAGEVLILFDDYDGPWDFGPLYANMTANLVNHYGFDSRFMDVSLYEGGDMNNYDYAIYIGSIYGNTLPPGFIQDVANKVRPVFWINYNLWEISWDPDVTVDWGFDYLYTMITANTFNVSYQEMTFSRHSLYNEINLVQITDPTKATANTLFVNEADPTETYPYIVQGDGLWYCGENPLTWLVDGDRYLVFAELLGDFFGSNYAYGKRGMVRLEDVAPAIADTKKLKKIGRFLRRKGVPFAIGVIPVFKDPTSVYFGYPVEFTLSDDPELVATLKKLQSWGGTIIMHGYTHQYDRSSGDDWEFWIEETNVPVPEDSVEWVQARIDAGLAEFHAVGLYPDVWETPHYSASQLDYHVIYNNFDIGYERTRVYNNFDFNSHHLLKSPLTISNVPAMKSAAIGLADQAPRVRGIRRMTPAQYNALPFHSAGVVRSTTKSAGDEDVYILQYMPFGLRESIYGHSWIPENMGYLDPELFLPADLLAISEKLGVLKEPVASFFYHHDYDINFLKNVVKGMISQGYDFISIDELMVTLP